MLNCVAYFGNNKGICKICYICQAFSLDRKDFVKVPSFQTKKRSRIVKKSCVFMKKKQRDVKILTESPGKKLKKFVCPSCFFSYNYKQNLCRHMNEKHQAQVIGNSVIPNNENKRQSNKKRKSLKNTVSDAAYDCPPLGVNKETQNLEMLSVNTSLYACPRCGKHLKSLAGLKNHKHWCKKLNKKTNLYTVVD